MSDDPRSLPAHEGSVFDRAGFDGCLAAYPLGWSLPVDDTSRLLIRPAAPAHVLFERGSDRQIRVYDVEGTLRTTAKTPDDRAFVEEIYGLCRETIERLARQMRETLDRYRAMTIHESAVLTRAGFGTPSQLEEEGAPASLSARLVHSTVPECCPGGPTSGNALALPQPNQTRSTTSGTHRVRGAGSQGSLRRVLAMGNSERFARWSTLAAEVRQTG